MTARCLRRQGRLWARTPAGAPVRGTQALHLPPQLPLCHGGGWAPGVPQTLQGMAGRQWIPFCTPALLSHPIFIKPGAQPAPGSCPPGRHNHQPLPFFFFFFLLLPPGNPQQDRAKGPPAPQGPPLGSEDNPGGRTQPQGAPPHEQKCSAREVTEDSAVFLSPGSYSVN